MKLQNLSNISKTLQAASCWKSILNKYVTTYMRWADSSSEQLKLNAQILMKTFTLNRVQSVLQSFTKTDFRFSS